MRALKMKEDESVPEMFHRLQVLVNDLKAHGEMVEDKDFFRKFLICLPSRFGTLVNIIVRSDLNTMTPNQVLGDIMTDDTYRDDDEKEEKKEKKDEKKDEKKKSVAFKATSRARQSKIHQVKMMAHGIMMMMRRWFSLSRNLASS